MRLLTLAIVVLAAATNASGAEWYENLPPGINRTEIRSIAGPPSSSVERQNRYNVVRGYLELSYDESGTLLKSVHLDQEGSHISTPYFTSQGTLEASHIHARRDYLNEGNYMYLPKFEGPFIDTRRFEGRCYKIDDSFLVIQPILGLPGSGFFADKAAKVTLIDADRNETVLYRAMDNWKNLKPPQLTEKQIEERTNRLRSLGMQAIGKPMKEIFGERDSEMGSGIYREIFYLQDALAVITSFNLRDIYEISIAYPGYKSISFKEWVERE